MSERCAPHRSDTGRLQAVQARFAAFIGACFLALAGCGPRVVWYGKTPSREHDVAVLSNGDGQWVKVDAREGNKSRGVGVDALKFSPSGEYLAYPSQQADGWKVEVFSVSNLPLPGWNFKAYDGVGALVWSEDSRHLACAVEEKGRWRVVLDGKEQPSVESIRARSLILSAEGDHLVYAADEDGAVVVIVDGVKSLRYQSVARLTLSKQGKVALSPAKKMGRRALWWTV
ncbi:MAG: hypothetical protein IPK82_16565 [Polyangiaceae bacterium]|nr:hypothetical protein [Polyangiaceae bacterium]